jgi:D-amino-acid dehydrogenase
VLGEARDPPGGCAANERAAGIADVDNDSVQPMADSHFDVIVVGAGAVGACSALELVRAGLSVAIVERGEDWAAGCSWGNAGMIVPSHASPFAELRDFVKAARWLTKRDSPFGIDLTPALVPWTMRLLYECVNVRRARRATELLLSLAHESAQLHADLSAEGLDTRYKREGLLDVYQTEAAFRHARAELANRSDLQVMSAEEARTIEPLLGGPLAGAVLNPNEARCDPGRFVAAIGGAAVAAGATFLTGVQVTRLSAGQREVRVTTGSSELSADKVVLATGARAPELAPRLPVVSGTGCSIDLTGAETVPVRPMMLREARVAITPFDDRVRFGGTMLLARTAPQSVDQRRVEGILRAGIEAMPSLSSAERSTGWIGARPCTPDGVARVGWLGREQPNVAVAAGHAMHGIGLAPITGKLVQGLLEGKPDPRLARLAPDRSAA